MPPRRRSTALKRRAMAARTDLHVKASADDPRVVRARLAVERFRRMVPGLTGFARMITRDDNVRVQISASSPYTDGKIIYMRPPIELGDEIDHLRTMCDQRDLYGPLCPACLRMEEIMTGLFHEIAHIAFDSFAKVNDADKRDLLIRALREAGDPADTTTRAGKIKQRVDKGLSALEAVGSDSYVSISQLISPFLPMLINGMEDWRVNTALSTARPGTRGAFAARYRKYMEQGIHEMDGEVWFWRDRPANSQVIIGVLLKLCRYEFYRDHLTPEVVAVLDSAEMEIALRPAMTVRSARGVYEMAFGVLEAARAHGFLVDESDPEDDVPDDLPSMGDPGDDADKGDGDEPDETSDEEAGKGAPSDDADGEPGGESDTDESADEDSTGSSTGDDEEDAEGDTDASGSSPDRGDDGRDTDDESTDEGAAGDSADEGDSSTDIDAEISGDDSGGEDEDETDPDNAAGTGESGDEASDKDTERSESMDEGDGDDAEGGTEEDGEAGDSGDVSDHAPMGEPSEASSDLERFLGHDNPGWFPTDAEPKGDGDDEDGDPEDIDPEADTREIDRAVLQGEFFDRPASGMYGVQVFDDPDSIRGRYNGWAYAGESARRGMTEATEAILGPSLLRMRVAFADNAKRRKERNLKAGRVNTRTLGRRAATGDDRLFYKPSHPGRKDYFVVIGMDISGSTGGRRVQMIKSAALAQAELLHRTGVKFAVYAHTGNISDSDGATYDLHIYSVKGPDEPWGTKQKDKLRDLYASAANLDGHTMEYYRKVCDSQRTTDKVIMYYTDGAMPAENYSEELEVLNDELKVIDRKGYVLVAVGVNNTEPEDKYGIETVRLDDISDVPNVVKFLEKRLEA